MLPVVGRWRLPLLKAMAVFCNYSTAACEAIVVISQCNEILLTTALALTNSVAFYLSTMLRLNTFLRLTLAGALFSREELDQRRHSSCSTWPSSRTFGQNGCSPLCWGEGTSVERVKSVQSALRAVPTLCRCARSVCAAVLALVHVVLSLLCGNVRPTVSSIVTICGCIRPALLTLLTVTGYSTQLLDLSSV